jgi:hypothetical protein
VPIPALIPAGALEPPVQGGPCPPRWRRLIGPAGECIGNARAAAANDPALRYREGLAWDPSCGHWYMHSWCEDPLGVIVEVTTGCAGALYQGFRE